MTKKKTHGLTILMLKDNINDAPSSIKELASVQVLDVTLGNVAGKLYYKQNPSHKPSWVKLFEPAIGATLNSLFQRHFWGFHY